MSDLLLSLIESIASAVQASRERQGGQPVPPAPTGRSEPPRLRTAPPSGVAAALPLRPPAAPSPAAAPAIFPDEPPPGPSLVAGLFSGHERLMQSVVAAEVLGPPISLRRHNPWDVPGVQ